MMFDVNGIKVWMDIYGKSVGVMINGERNDRVDGMNILILI